MITAVLLRQAAVIYESLNILASAENEALLKFKLRARLDDTFSE